jgi:hypothetical protein
VTEVMQEHYSTVNLDEAEKAIDNVVSLVKVRETLAKNLSANRSARPESAPVQTGETKKAG